MNFHKLFLIFYAFSNCNNVPHNYESCLYEKIIYDYEEENFKKEGNPSVNYVADELINVESVYTSIISSLKEFPKPDIDTIKSQIFNKRKNTLSCIKSKKNYIIS